MASAEASRAGTVWALKQWPGIALVVAVLTLSTWHAANSPASAFDALKDLQAGRDFGGQPITTRTGWLGRWFILQVALQDGPFGLVFLAAILAAFKAWLYLLAFRRLSNSLLGAGLGVGLVELTRWLLPANARPQTLAEVCWAGLLVVCTGCPLSRRGLWAVAVLVGLWANLHASFPLAFLLLAVLLVSRFMEAARTRQGLAAACEDVGVRRLALAGGLAVAAVCLNPAGPKLLGDALRASRQAIGQALLEWQAINLPQVGGLPFLASLLIVLVTIRLSPRRFSVAETGLLVSFGLGAWIAPGFVFWWATVWPFALLPHWSAIYAGWVNRSKDATAAPQFALE